MERDVFRSCANLALALYSTKCMLFLGKATPLVELSEACIPVVALEAQRLPSGSDHGLVEPG